MNKPQHSCDAQARAGMWVIGFMGSMGLIALVGIIVYSMLRKITPEAVVLATLGGTVTGAMSGLPSLLARMSGQPDQQHQQPAQDVLVKNPPSDPANVTVTEDKK